MSLLGGDLTTPARFKLWFPGTTSGSDALIAQLISSCSNLIHTHLNRGQLYSTTWTRIFDAVGNYQLVLPDYPVTGITSVQLGPILLKAAPLPTLPNGNAGSNWGYRWVPWAGDLPGSPSVLEFSDGYFWAGVQNVKVTYTAGYLIANELGYVPDSPGPYVVTVLQPQGIWCRDNGVSYESSGIALTPVKSSPGEGEYIPPPDTAPGLYTFSVLDEGEELNFSYSFIPSDLEEACIQWVAERYSYRSRIGVVSQSLGGQESIRYSRSGIPPEIADMLHGYVSVLPPLIGAPV